MTETGLPFRVTISGWRWVAFIIANLASLGLRVNLGTLLDKLPGFLLHTDLPGAVTVNHGRQDLQDLQDGIYQ